MNLRFSELFKRLASDVGLDHPTVKYCIRRIESEGLTFLTETLPELAKAVLAGIESGNFQAHRPTSFCWQQRSLRYFRGLLDRIFDPNTGKLVLQPDPAALYCLRQVCEYFYKLAVKPTKRKLAKASAKYVKTSQQVADAKHDYEWGEILRRNSETYYSVLYRASFADILACGPRHGPGSFFESASRQVRSTGGHWAVYKHLPDEIVGTGDEAVASHIGYFKPYPSSPTKLRIKSANRTAEVLFVPKDSRSPRVISKEPLHVIRAQLAFFDWMSKALEKATSKRVNFGDQTINQRLARESSVDRRHATLDLSEASDRVSARLAFHVFRHAPGVRKYLTVLRSKKWVLNNEIGNFTGEIASVGGMGSGLTFPILAHMCHLSVCSGISAKLSIPYDEVMRSVYVYGDDIIVPLTWYDEAVYGLERSQLVVNLGKSYRRSNFRESCGADYFYGVDVAPIRCRLASAGKQELLPERTMRALKTNGLSDNLITALVMHSRELRKHELHSAAAMIEHVVSSVIPLPPTEDGSVVLGRYVSNLDTCLHRDPEMRKRQLGLQADGSIQAKVRGPFVVHSRSVCPYKYLAQCLVEHEPGSLLGFGNVAIPRRNVLRDVRVTYNDLRGSQYPKAEFLYNRLVTCQQ